MKPSPSRRSCQYRQPPPCFASHKSTSSMSVDSRMGASPRWSLRSKHPSASFAAAIVPRVDTDDAASIVTHAAVVAPLLGSTATEFSSKSIHTYSSPFKFKTGSPFRFSNNKNSRMRVQSKPFKSTSIPPTLHLRLVKRNPFSYDSLLDSCETPISYREIPISYQSTKFFEHTFDFKEAEHFVEDCSVTNHFRRHSASEYKEEHSVPPPSSLVAIEEHFIQSFEPMPTFDDDISISERQSIPARSHTDLVDCDESSVVAFDELAARKNAPEEQSSLCSSAALLPPPPCAVQKRERREIKNLWVDYNASDDDDDLTSLSDSQGDSHSILSLVVDEWQGIVMGDELRVASLIRSHEQCSMSPDHPEGNYEIDTTILPSLSHVEWLSGESNVSELQNELSNGHASSNGEDVTDCVLAWGALVALLSTPSLSILPKQSRTQSKILWAYDHVEDEDIISLQASEGSLDDLNLSALQPDSYDTVANEESLLLRSKEDAVNSTIAWGALTALLGLSAPTCVHQKGSSPVKNVWTDDVADQHDDMASLVHRHILDIHDSDSVPSMVADSQCGSCPSSPGTVITTHLSLGHQ